MRSKPASQQFSQLHFDEFQEIEESPKIRADKQKISLVYPDQIAKIIQDSKQEEMPNRGLELDEADDRGREVDELLDMQQSFTNTMYQPSLPYYLKKRNDNVLNQYQREIAENQKDEGDEE